MKNKLKPIEFGLLPLLFAVMAVFPLLGFSGSNGNNPTKSEKKQFLSKLENAPMMAPCSLSYTRALDNIGYCDGTIPVTSLTIAILGNSGQYNHHMVVPSPAPKIVEKCDGTATITARFCGTNGNGNYVNNACWDAVINLSGRTTTNPGYMTGCAGNPDAGWYNYKYGSLIFNGVAGGLYNAAQIEIKSGNPNTTMQFGNGAAYHYEENNWQFGAGTWGDVIVNNPGTNNIRDNGAGDLQLSVGPKIADMVSWNYGCSSCRSVDQYGVGLQNTWNGNSYTLTIPNSSNVVSVILQAYFRDLSGHSNCFPQSVTLSTAAGSVVTPYYVIPGDINGQNPSSESASKGYRAQIDGATGTATLTVPTSCKPISFDVIVFRNDCTRGGTSGKSIDQFFYPGGPTPSACYNIPISTATGARDLKVRVPISDLSCGPTASVTVNISGVTSQSQTVTNCSPPLGADFQYVDFTFTNVPGSTNNVQVCTQAISGSYTINGVISVETECCTATVDAGANKSICQGTSTTISATGSGGTSPYSYSWSNGLGAGQSKTVSPANTTTYTVTVTDNTGCTNTDFVVITVNPIPGANAGADFTKTCQINLSGKQIGSAPVAGMAYSWLPNTGLSSSTIANPTANPSTTTTYTVTVTNSTTGCTATDQVIVTVNTNPPTANAGADFTKTCTSNPNGAPIGSTPVSGMSYIWAPTDGLSSSTIANPTANPTATTTYTLTVTNTSNGCTATDQVIVTVNTNPPTANAGSDFTKTCQINTSGKQIGSGPVAGMTYSWSPIAGLSNSAISNPIANPTTSTTYTVTVTNPNSGCTATDQVIVTVNINPPTANAGADFTKTCTQNIGGAQIGSAPVTGMTYAWLPTTGLSSASVSNPTANPSTTTTYTLTVTNTTNGCKATDQVVVTVNTNPPTANAGSNFTKTCTSNPSGAQIGSAPVTGMTYAWLPTTGLSSGTIANPTANPTTTTTYTLTVTNTANGCTATDDVVVIVNTNPPTANAGSNFTKTCTSNPNGAQIGSAPVTGMTYAWLPTTGLSSGTIANPIANPTATTTYTLTVTNTANGCTATDQVVVSVNTNPPAANAGAAFTKTCTQNVNGAQIGTAPVAARSYLWSPTAGLSSSSISNPIANPLNTTTYTLTVTNTNNGCTATDQVVVTVNTTVPTANAGTDKTKCANSPAVQIGTAPVAGMSYIWSPTTGLSSGTIANPTANPTTTTTYTVTVTNTTNGCTATDQVIVTVNPLPVSGISAPGSVCATEGAFFQVNPPVAGATYSWTFDGGTPASSTASSVTVSWPISMIGTTRNVVLTVTSSNGCNAVYNHAINITQNPTANAGPDKEVCEGGSTAIGGSPSGPSGSSFLWTPNLYLNSNTVANPISTPPVSITYTLTTTINGCTKTDQVTVTVNTLLNPLVSATANPDPICAGKTSTLTAQGSANGGRGGPFQYIWNNGLGAGAIKTTPALNQNTTYVVTVVDAAQCTATNSVTVDVTPCGSIGDYVWIDTDGDGIQDANESGLNGVTVLLKDQNGNVLSTKITTTGPSGLPGYYIFPDLMANSYIVMFMKPTGYQFTNDNSAGSTDTNDSDADLATGNTPVINLNPGQVVTNVDAGVYQPASIGNFVWEDTNGNGIQDPTEIGVNGVTVLLKDENGIVLKTTITATNGTSLGYYQFTGLEPGNYIVMFMSPSGYTLSDPNVPGSNDNNDSDANQSTGNTGIVNVTSGEIDQSVDAGIYRPATIGNFVWDDTNGNGIQDAGEPGINGVTVLLKDANGATLATTVTATNGATQGYYQFTNLEPGTYAVMFMTPTGYNPTESNAPGSVDTNDSDPNAQGTTPTVTVTSGGTNQTLDAGFYRPATIGNFVWKDTNGNGIQDAGEPGINGVTVLLKDANGATLATTVTATNGATQGYYQFTNLEPGSYIVMFMTPTGYSGSPANSGNDDIDSDPNPLTGNTSVVTIISGQTNLSVDAGFVCNVIVSLPVDFAICFGESAQINAAASNGIPQYVYNWSAGLGSGTPKTVSPVITTTYVVTVTDAVGCTASDALILTVNQRPLASAGADFTKTCTTNPNGSQIGSAPVTGNTYSWSPVTGLSSSTIANPTANPTATTTYTVTVTTTANGCTATDQVVVTVNTTPPTADAGADFTKTCTTNPNGAQIGSAMVVGNTYSWSPTTGLSGSTIANPIANPTTTTTYTVTVTNIANGCTASDQIVVNVNTAIPSADAGTDFTKTCTTNPNGLQIGSASVAGNSYSWSPATGLSSSTVSNPTANPTATTTYTVTVTTTANGCTATDQVVVTVNTTPPTANAGADFTKTCTTNPNGSQIGSAPVTGNTYSWSPAAGLSNSLIANPTANPTATTTYTLTVTTTANGCTATDQVVVTVNTSVPNASATNDGPLTCNKTSVTLTATGGGSYLWSNGASTSTTNVSAPGSYQVTVTNTASGCTAVASTTVIEEDKITIGNFVWLDTNGNGCQEVNESGINGVTVKLYDSANNLIATTVTTNNTSGQAGYYEFITCKGSYYVNFSKPTSSYKYTETKNCGNDATDSDPNSSTGNTSVVVLNPGQTNNDLDAGFFLPAIIGDYVWVDKNANGIQEPNETGVNGVTVILKDASGNVISTTLTANNPLNGNPGYYSFIVDPGTYVVQFVAPNGSVLTQPNAPGSNTSNDSDPNASGNSNPITVTSGQSVNTIDAGVYIPAKLGDYVWEDANKNGIQEPNETGVNGVTILLKNVSGSTLQTTVTSNNPTNGNAGYYLFSNLTPGDYIVMVMKPNGFNFTTQNVVTGGTDSDVNTVSGNTATVNLESGETDLTVDAGIYRTATLGNYVWYDLDKDGIQDPTEQGLNGFTVNLYTSTGTFVASTVTSTNPNTTLPGYYQFANLDPGTYYIQVVAPANQGYVPTVPNNNVTGTESTDSDLSGANGPNTTTSVTLTSGQNYADLDAGYYLDNKIGDYVWEDTNRDGLQTTGEPGINGVTVNLFNSAGSLVKSTITANNPSNGTAGYYQFTDLTIGSYYVEFIQPTGYFVTTAIVGVNTTIDSDLNNANGAGTTSNISVIANTNNQTIDAGFIKGVKIGDFVWNDTGASNDKNDPGFKNGIQDPGENPEPNVTVRLKDAAGNTLQTTTTDNNGMYMFTVEPGKTYYLQFVAPFNRDFAPANVSSNSLDNVDSDVTNTFGTGTTDLFVVNTTDNFTFDAGIWDLALPLDLISFEGRNAVTHNQLTWVTANEVNVNRFSVERRKTSEKTFYEIGTVQAIHAASYGYDDYDVAEAGTYYYRLRMVDNDGSYEFSPIISIEVSVNKTLGMEIKPNPVNHYTVIHIEGLNAGDHTIEVFDLTGKILTKLVNTTSSKESEWDQTLDMSSFSAGTYYVRLISNDKSLTEKIMIAR